ncbi:Uncharacterised protein [Amycolatopsis camponoti]|uniref:Uncharacterized protein n=1 Tax=Amycolatopsis camponoti TaxID=2606593 RepID=A0A6I8LTC3_9PSEU|nr:Uncharacterised protein [Amycolatopsis camponoti]
MRPPPDVSTAITRMPGTGSVMDVRFPRASPAVHRHYDITAAVNLRGWL